MKQLLNDLVKNWWNNPLPAIKSRDVDVRSYFDPNVRKIVSVVGFRRVGKTFTLLDFAQKYGKEKCVYINFDHPHMRRDNNLLECFNGIIKPRLDLMKGFKKQENLDRYLKLFLLEYRFHSLKESRFADRRGKSPLQIAGVNLPQYYNFLAFIREELHLSYQPKIS